MTKLKKNIKNLRNKIYNYAINNSESVITASIMASLSFVVMIESITEGLTINEFLELFLENSFYIILYIFLINKFKHIKLNFIIKNLIIIIFVSFIWNIIDFNYNILNDKIVFSEKTNYFITNFIHEFFDIFSFVVSALFVQYVINKLIINNLYRQEAGFIAKIPAAQRHSIYLIMSKENYIEVYYGSNNESKLINYRISNAVKELPKENGLQVHRSYWVSLPMLKNMKRIEGKYYIFIGNKKIPISNTYLKKAKYLKESL